MSPSSPTQPSELARHIKARRTELGLSVEALSQRVGIDPAYLHYFEESPSATLSAGTLLLVAAVLGTSPRALGAPEPPSVLGNGRAGHHPELLALTTEQCEAHLAAGGIGRVVYVTDRGPVALPVNFEFSEGSVVISTNEGKAAALAAADVVAFEIDRVDATVNEGWSVLVSGRALRITEPADRGRLASLDLETWAGGGHHELVLITPTEVTGRVIVQRVIQEPA
ncbi:MAG TPA: pyridoxamine 5'-phosphate oxidase family protein [Acidimicrobiales bacterium]|nr:pyridoxamine 5'-phosphate oxidase family protein [Acidimicrobiales bacterium]